MTQLRRVAVPSAGVATHHWPVKHNTKVIYVQFDIVMFPSR